MNPHTKTWLALAVLIITVGAGMTAVLRYQPISSPVTPSPTATPSPSAPATDWQLFTSPELSLSITHPSTVTIHTQQPKSAALVFIGPTQTESTELFDGYALTFTTEMIPSGSTTLEDYAE